MPVASGSIAFLGAARFQGYWDATSNNATGSGADGAPTGAVVGLFATGSSTAGGYSLVASQNLTASGVCILDQREVQVLGFALRLKIRLHQL